MRSIENVVLRRRGERAAISWRGGADCGGGAFREDEACEGVSGRHNGGAGGGQCFLKGTKIQTALGEQKVEDFAMGARCQRFSEECDPFSGLGAIAFERGIPTSLVVKDALPVRVARSALAPNFLTVICT